ncbi:sigma-54-dependent Fis family transcriptional regulator [Shewanella cyperi]|uniref:Sigma-54-dependent Fis family transcriptional regulator n=1 Tax=Shewanella cyperi TaxID=2814292 RepID=A0A974XMY2_9GAMM|nr:sigma-54 dependent transcriptional regulator [Shewanella cyperi]QSX31339.1 sigma-54-dependent Fis family transcriptional regulator [Shewanella cyperi]
MNLSVPSDSKGTRASQRELLVLDPNNDLPDISQVLSGYHWHCLKVSNAADALKLIDRHGIKIAVAMIHQNDTGSLAKDLVNIQQQFPQLHWLAVSDEVLGQSCSWLLTVNVIDYFHLPLDWQRFNDALGHGLGMSELASSANARAREPHALAPIRGEHPLIKNLRHSLEKLGPSDETVLLSGETGSGKGLCAKWLHRYSLRQHGPFVVVNCGALPASLIQSTLFGHEKGAFTGAERRYIGHLEQANGGTLFLDEIADLPLDLQVNLLQFLDDKHIFRVGGCKPVELDCRLLFASHQDLESAVDEGRFREDLYHRINVLRLHVPSLREYLEDIMLLAEQFLDDFNHGNDQLAFSDDAVQAISHYNWPGNVRELQNRIRRAAVMVEGPLICARDLGLEPAMLHRWQNDLASQREELDTEVILKAISDNRHNISAAARALNISRSTLYRLLKKSHLNN